MVWAMSLGTRGRCTLGPVPIVWPVGLMCGIRMGHWRLGIGGWRAVSQLFSRGWASLRGLGPSLRWGQVTLCNKRDELLLA